jgi:hypothetical protein
MKINCGGIGCLLLLCLIIFLSLGGGKLIKVWIEKKTQEIEAK